MKVISAILEHCRLMRTRWRTHPVSARVRRANTAALTLVLLLLFAFEFLLFRDMTGLLRIPIRDLSLRLVFSGEIGHVRVPLDGAFSRIVLSLFLSIVGGVVLRFLLILKVAECDPIASWWSKAEGDQLQTATETSGFVTGDDEGRHLLRFFLSTPAATQMPRPPPEAPGSLDAFVKCLDLRRSHAIYVPPTINGGLYAEPHTPGPDAADQSDQGEAQYIREYGFTSSVEDGERRREARRKWYRTRKIDALLATGRLSDAVSIDRTTLSILQELEARDGQDALVEAGLLRRGRQGALSPTSALLMDAPVFPHYNAEGQAVALSHSLSPITHPTMPFMLHDEREISKASQSTLFLTSGITYALWLRRFGLHAVAIQPHVWAHGELVGRWFSDLRTALHAGPISQTPTRTAAEEFAHHVAELLTKWRIKNVAFDLADCFPRIFGLETGVHFDLPHFLFCRFVLGYLGPHLRVRGIHLLKPPSFLRRAILPRVKRLRGTPADILHNCEVDSAGERALFGIAPFVIDPSHPWVTRTRRPALPAVRPPKPTQIVSPVPASPYSCTFVPGKGKRDSKWRIRFKEEVGDVKDSTGMRYIFALLERPRLSFFHEDLSRAHNPKTDTRVLIAVEDYDDRELRHEYAERGIDPSTVQGRPSYSFKTGGAGEQQLCRARAQVKSLEKEKRRMENSAHTATGDHADDRAYQRVLDDLAEAERLVKALEKFQELQPVVKAVAKNLDRAKAVLAKTKGLSGFAAHVKDFLSASETSEVSYDADPAPLWRISWPSKSEKAAQR